MCEVKLGTIPRMTDTYSKNDLVHKHSTMSDIQFLACENFRDTGKALDSLGQDARCKGLKLPHGRIVRGGKIDLCGAKDIGLPNTVFNLKLGPDDPNAEIFAKHKATGIQEAIANSIDKYNTKDKDVREWITRTLQKVIEVPQDRYPIMFHCAAGKDRTGIIVAVILLIIGFPLDIVLEEFRLSKGEFHGDIEAALAPIHPNPRSYLRNKVNTGLLKKNVLGL
mmetsp:Transcript_498/g.593  ORF Transcript_498/g.593 Transcript_498/m.593 type:complete len:223 (-) Transcript_498:115-783(-)